MKNLELGKCVQGFLLVFGMGTDVLVLIAFVDMYSKMGDHKRARSVFIFQYHACKKSGFMECYHLREANFMFDRMKNWNVITWIAMLVGLVHNRDAEDAIRLFCRMQKEGVTANSTTLSLGACGPGKKFVSEQMQKHRYWHKNLRIFIKFGRNKPGNLHHVNETYMLKQGDEAQ
ncbi:hypothetical protein J1N35_023900 [Gossypium stocksii]|uniref:Pentatricopeptide repeat-containing protein n=1 Tax=Gossypium stocksii TaxID=47602 RepID=A0A9D3VL45_9ROSI|nr:hypothetical protein J1N35_023900 [Gossypium stocksii]